MTKRTYTLTSEGIRRLNMNSWKKSAAMFILIALGFSYYVHKDPLPSGRTLPAMVLIFSVLAFSLWRGINRNAQVLGSLRITVDQDYIARQILRVPDMAISRPQIISMRMLGAGLLIVGKQGNILIPKGLESYDELVGELSHGRCVEVSACKEFNPVVLNIAVGAVMMVAFGALWTTKSRAVHLSVGIPLAIVLIACGIAISRSRYIDRRTKIGTVSVMCLPLFSILAIVVFAFLEKY